MVETIAAKRPLMYVRDGSQKSLFFFQKQFAWDFIWHKNLETWSSSKDNWNGCRVLLCSENCWKRREKKLKRLYLGEFVPCLLLLIFLPRAHCEFTTFQENR